MRSNYEVVIIGGGIIGSSIAYYLAKAQMDVALLDGGAIGDKTTKAAAGMLGAHSECEDDASIFFPFARSSQQAYRELKDELYEISQIDIGYREGGILKLAFDESDKQKLHYLLQQPSVQWLDDHEVKKLETAVADHIVGAAYIKDDVNVIPTQTCQAFAKGAQVFGASIFENTHVYGVQKLNDSYFVKTTKGTIEAKRVVVATGVYSNGLLQDIGISEQLTPVKGESIVVQTNQPILQHTLFYEKSYIVPRNNGKLVIGATMIEDEWSESISLQSMEDLINTAKAMIPSSSEWKIDRFTSGLRPATFDGQPFIGRHPEDEGIFIACGHFRNGILLAPATAKLIRDLILEKAVNKEWLGAFRIDRRQLTKV